MLAVTELCGKLGLTEALDEAMGPVKQRRRGFTGGQVLTGMAAAQRPARTSWSGWTGCAPMGRPAGDAGAGPAASTATGLARRFTPEHGAAPRRPGAGDRPDGGHAARRAGGELAQGPVTSTSMPPTWRSTGTRNAGWPTPIRGSGPGPHVAAWAETEIPLAADLLAGDQDPRSSVVALRGGRWPPCRRPSATGRRRPGGRSRCAPMPGTSPGTSPAPPPRRTWRSRSAPSGSPACGRHWPGSARTPGGTRPAWKTRRSPSHPAGPPNGPAARSCDPPGPPGPRAGLRRPPVPAPPHPAPRQRALPIPELEAEPPSTPTASSSPTST